MMIVITRQDFSRLSANCRHELLHFFTSYAESSPHDDMSMIEGDIDSEQDYEEDVSAVSLEPDGKILGDPQQNLSRRRSQKNQKKIVEIDINQARQLVKNISLKSKKVLEKFVFGEWVSIFDLIGPELEYRDLSELKKSLVGAVNRRLRTVTSDRSAVLFLSNQDRSEIRITSISATSLRKVLLPENLPNDL